MLVSVLIFLQLYECLHWVVNSTRISADFTPNLRYQPEAGTLLFPMVVANAAVADGEYV